MPKDVTDRAIARAMQVYCSCAAPHPHPDPVSKERAGTEAAAQEDSRTRRNLRCMESSQIRLAAL